MTQIDWDSLEFDKKVEWVLEPISCWRSRREHCVENDIVQIFDTKLGLIGIALGFRNTGFYTGLAIAAGQPIGFGKVAYLTGNIPMLLWARYPPSDDSIRNEDKIDEQKDLQLTDTRASE